MTVLSKMVARPAFWWGRRTWSLSHVPAPVTYRFCDAHNPNFATVATDHCTLLHAKRETVLIVCAHFSPPPIWEGRC